MKITRRQLRKLIIESIIDSVSENLPEIFNSEEELIPEVRNVILDAINRLSLWLKNNHPDLKITQVFVVGAAVTYQYGPESDIDVSVVIPGLGNRRNIVDDWMSSNLVYPNFTPGGNISRPFEFKPMEDNQNYSHVDAAYDPYRQAFLKRTSREQAQGMYDRRMDDESYENKLYDSLQKILQTNFKRLYTTITTSDNLEEIKQEMIGTYERKGVLKKLRSSSYEQAPDEGYVSQNWGSSNVAYKMLDRTDYLDVFDIIKPVVKSNQPVTPELLDDLKIALEAVIYDDIGFAGVDYSDI